MANSLMAMLGASIDPLLHQFGRAKAEARTAGKEIGSAFAEHIEGSLGKLASVALLEESVRSVVEYADKVGDLSQRLGISTDAVQAWDYALQMNGSSIDAAAGFFEKLAVSRDKALKGNGEAIASFKQLGVTMDDLKSKRVEDIAQQISQAFQTGDPQTLIADLREVGGKSAGEMVAAFRDGLSDLVNEAHDKGIIIGDEVINGLKDAADRSKLVASQFRAGFAPVVDFIAKLGQMVWRGWGIAVEGAVELARTGSVRASVESMRAFKANWIAEDKMLEERAKKRANPLPAVNLEETEPKARRDAEERHAKRILDLREQLRKEQEQTDLGAMTKAEKLEELARRRAKLMEQMRAATSEEDRIKAALELEKNTQQSQQLSKETKERDRSPVKQSVNSLQQIGAYATSFDPHLKEAQTTNGHLETIKTTLNRMEQKGGSVGGVDY